MRVEFRGVRGSFPVCRPQCLRYGGNTPCLQIEAGGEAILIDAGTGIRAAGKALAARGVGEIHLLISHTHWDHVQGFPHFAPLYQRDAQVRVYSLRHPDTPLRRIFADQQRQVFFPVLLEQVPARVEFIEVEEGEDFAIGEVRVRCRRLNHPSVTGGYRLEWQGRVLAYVSDVDLSSDLVLGEGMGADTPEERRRCLRQLAEAARDLAHRADLLVCDTFFSPEEYDPTWGHSRPEDALRLAREARVRRLALFHHEPHRSDAELDQVLAHYRGQSQGEVELLAAAEGLVLNL